MKYKIGVISVQAAMANIQTMDAVLQEFGEIIYFSYNGLEHLSEIYLANVNQLDGILFSGAFSYEYVYKKFGESPIPQAYFELREQDYYRTFTELFYNHTHLKITDIAMERPQILIDLKNTFNGKLPHMFQNISVLYSQPDALNHLALYYRNLWTSGKIKFVLTRFSDIAESLSKWNIPYEIPIPGNSSMLDTILSFASDLEYYHTNHRFIIGFVQSSETLNPMELQAMYQFLILFNQRHNVGLVIRQEINYCTILANEKNLYQLLKTSNTNYLLSWAIHHQISPNISIGWGIGNNLLQAKKRAKQALSESLKHPYHPTYLVDEENNIVGPFLTNKTISSDQKIHVHSHAQKLCISKKHFSQLVALYEKYELTEFTSETLEVYLNITNRSANRILKNLVDHHYAHKIGKLPSIHSGRPKYIYFIDFKKLLNI